jgi:hypothetical protein
MIERLAAALFLLPVQLAAQGVGPNQCTGPPYGDDPALYAGTKESIRNMAEGLAKTEHQPTDEFLKTLPALTVQLCEARFDKVKRVQFYSLKMTDLDFATQQTVGLVLQYLSTRMGLAQARRDAEKISPSQFLARASSFGQTFKELSVTGYYLVRNNLPYLSDHRGADVPLMLDKALPALQQTAVACGPGNCILTIRGVFSMCSQTGGATGATEQVPCLIAWEGERIE